MTATINGNGRPDGTRERIMLDREETDAILREFNYWWGKDPDAHCELDPDERIIAIDVDHDACFVVTDRGRRLPHKDPRSAEAVCAAIDQLDLSDVQSLETNIDGTITVTTITYE